MTVAAIVAIAKWVHTMSARVDDHAARIDDFESEQSECRARCQETQERIALSETQHEYVHEALQELKADLKDVLRHLRGRSKG